MADAPKLVGNHPHGMAAVLTSVGLRRLALPGFFITLA